MLSRLARCTTPLLAVLAVHAFAGHAAAQVSAADAELARTLFKRGTEVLRNASAPREQLDQACADLGESQRRDPALGTLLALAICHDKQGRVATAWTEYQRVADLARKSPDATDKKRLDYATEAAVKLEGKVPRLLVQPPAGAAGLSLRLDGDDKGGAALGMALPLDPGEHRVEVAAPGKKSFTATVTVSAGGGTTTLSVPPLADAAAPPPPGPAVPPGPVAPLADRPPAPAPTPEGGGRSMPRFAAGLAVGGVGLAGVVVGSIFGVRTFQKKGEITLKDCDVHNTCNAAGVALQEDAHRSATISTVAFAVGLTAVAGGVALVATSGSSAQPRSAWIAPGPGGLLVGGRF